MSSQTPWTPPNSSDELPPQSPLPQQPGYGPGGWVAPLSPQPGILPLRPLTIGDIYSATMMAIRGNPAATLGLALVLAVLVIIPSTAFDLFVISRLDFAGDDLSIAFDSVVQGGASLLSSGFQVLGTFIFAGFMAFVIGQGAIGRKVSASETWAKTRSRVPTLLLANLLVVVGNLAVGALIASVPIMLLVQAVDDGASDPSAVVGPLMLLFFLLLLWAVAATFVAVKLSMLNPVIVLERSGTIASLKRSWNLTRGSWWRIFGITVLTGILTSIAVLIVTIPISFGFLAAFAPAPEDVRGTATAGALGGAFSSLLAFALVTPFSAGVTAVLYLDLRMRHEGLDTQLLAAATERAEQAQ